MRKISVNKNLAISVLIVMALLFSSMALTVNSQAFKPGTANVNLVLYYENSTQGPSPFSFASSSTAVTFSTVSGQTVRGPITGYSISTTLPFGEYKVTIPELYSFNARIGSNVLSSAYTGYLNITTSSFTTQNITIPVELTSNTTVNLTGISPGNTASVSFSTNSGYTFISGKTANYTSNSFHALLPLGVSFFANVIYGGESHIYTETVPANNTITIDLSTDYLFGVVNALDGSQISKVNVAILNETSLRYTALSFTGNTFSLFTDVNKISNTALIISSPGYAPSEVNVQSAGAVTVPSLISENASVATTYTVNYSLGRVSEFVNFTFNNGTAVPFLPNSTIGSIYWQMKLDNVNLYTVFSSYLETYTNSSFKINGNGYEMRSGSIGLSIVKPTVLNKWTLTAEVNATYNNSALSNVSAINNVSIFATATNFTSGQVNYTYSFAYANTSLALESSNFPTSTFKSPINISTQASSHWVNMKFTAVKGPKFIDQYIKFFWNGLNSSKYVLNASMNNTAFVVPTGTAVYMNVSNAYFNPVTGTNDYLLTGFRWFVDGTSVSNFTNGKTYNNSFSFGTAGKNYSVVINATSPSNGTNQTTFYVYAFSGALTVNYSVNYSGKIHFNGTYNGTSPIVSVPQNTLSIFSVYNSSAGIGKYFVPLLYKWKFTNFTTQAVNATYTFSKPNLENNSYQYANVTVMTVTGQSRIMEFFVHVNDTTKPIAYVNMYNATGKAIGNPVAGQIVNFTALSKNNVISKNSRDPYDSNFGHLKFNWTVRYGNNGTIAPVNQSASIYTIVNDSQNDPYDNGTWITIKFTTLNVMEMSLNVTNKYTNLTGYANLTLTISVVTPRIAVNSVYIPGTLTQNVQTTIYVNVTNQGTITANGFYLLIWVGGKVVADQNYSRQLKVNANANVSLNWTPRQTGSFTITITGSNTSEDSSGAGFFASLGEVTQSVTVNPPGYVTPLIIGGIILVIVVVGYVYYKLSTGGFRKKSASSDKLSLLEQKKLQEKKQNK